MKSHIENLVAAVVVLGVFGCAGSVSPLSHLEEVRPVKQNLIVVESVAINRVDVTKSPASIRLENGNQILEVSGIMKAGEWSTRGMSSWWKARPDDADDSNAGPAKQPSDKQLDVVLFLYGSNFEVNHGIVKSFWVEKRHCKQQDDTMEFRVRVEIPRSIGKSVIDLQLIDAEESLVRGRKQQSLLGVPIWRCELTK